MDNDVIDLRDQVAVLRRRWRIIALFMVLGVAAALAVAYVQRPMYSATVQLLVSPTEATDESSSGELMAPEEISTQVTVVESLSTAQRVRAELGLRDRPGQLLQSLTVEQVEDQRVLEISSLRPTARGAAAVANAFATAYLAQRESQAAGVAQATTTSLQQRYDQVQAELAEVQTALNNADPTEIPGLESQERALTVQLTSLLEQIADTDATTSGTLDGGQILVPAVPPQSPAQPDLARLGPLGLLLGLILGIGLAFVRDHFDDGIRGEAALRRALHQKPVLGRIPHASQSRGNGRLVTLIDPQDPVSEAYRSLSSSVRFLLAASRPEGARSTHAGHRTLLVTSAGPAEGKTTVAGNLAVAAARFGIRVILVDGDLRKPGVAQRFGMGRPPGLSDLLANDDDVDSYLVDVGEPGLQVLAGGSIPPNPAELLASSATNVLLHRLRDRADLVIIDSAPVTQVADTREIIPAVDLVLMVVRHAVTRSRALADAIERIGQVGGSVSGAVFNDVPVSGDDNMYKYGYSRRGSKTAVHARVGDRAAR
jgi:polysaccharide biosynthesis transport protein